MSVLWERASVSLPTLLLLLVAMYTRAAASDYDDWATVYGNKGWSAAELLPLLRKVRLQR